MDDPVLQEALQDLVQKHGCHTVILYGSRSLGDFTEESDYDLIGFRDGGDTIRDARLIQGKFLDAFIYTSEQVGELEADLLRIRDGKVLIEKERFGRDLLSRLRVRFEQGPSPLPESERNTILVWVEKMLGRISKGDLEGNYRRVWLQYDLLQSYFLLRNRWYLGPKEAFQWIKENDPGTYQLFQRSLDPRADLEALKLLAARVVEV